MRCIGSQFPITVLVARTPSGVAYRLRPCATDERTTCPDVLRRTRHLSYDARFEVSDVLPLDCELRKRPSAPRRYTVPPMASSAVHRSQPAWLGCSRSSPWGSADACVRCALLDTRNDLPIQFVSESSSRNGSQFPITVLVARI